MELKPIEKSDQLEGYEIDQQITNKENNTSFGEFIDQLKIESQYTLLATDIYNPITYKDAIDYKYSQEWLKSMNTEILNLKRKNTWTLMDPPEGVNIIPGR